MAPQDEQQIPGSYQLVGWAHFYHKFRQRSSPSPVSVVFEQVATCVAAEAPSSVTRWSRRDDGDDDDYSEYDQPQGLRSVVD